MEGEVDEKELKAAGAEKLPDGRRGVRIHGWEIDSSNRSILTSLQLQQWEQKLQTSHLPEMIFGDSSLILKHSDSGTKIHFNAFDALVGWKQEALPPVEVPAAAKWKFRSKPFQQVILDYDYTFTTPYSGSGTVEINSEHGRGAISGEGSCNLHWEDCEEQIDVVALASKEPILFYDEVILYEDELADNGVSILTVKVRVMPSCWFLLLRYWLRVDGVLMRLRDTRMHCVFGCSTKPVITRESCWREATFQALSSKGYPADSAAYNDPSAISQRLPIVLHNTQKLIVPNKIIKLSCVPYKQQRLTKRLLAILTRAAEGTVRQLATRPHVDSEVEVYLGLAKESRRGRTRGAERSGGLRRGMGGEERREEALAVEMNVLENEPRQAIS
ncbi:hypothetical protein RJ639_011640 [Escallonia herrerae]|uniref:TIP41-like protein n=1 Tax=Escallonia herrerae TaxID=1293975 RepID=A0AA88VR17_9ASTE|nr:hypothetical protein RJ639_011640 [Escallonia herrerae]